MDMKLYGALCKKIETVASGYDHAAVTGDNTFSVFFTDGSKIDLTIPVPADGEKGDKGDSGMSVEDVAIRNGNLIFIREDGTEFSPIPLPSAAVPVSPDETNWITQRGDGLYVPHGVTKEEFEQTIGDINTVLEVVL